MDYSKLDPHERMVALSSGVLVVAGIVTAGWYGLYALTWLAVVAALGALFVVFQPQLAPGVSLPGTKGSLLVLLGGVAGVVMILALLTAVNLVFAVFGLPDILFLAAVAAGIALAWFGWQAFQADGGTLRIGAAPSSRTTTAPVIEAAVELEGERRPEA